MRDLVQLGVFTHHVLQHTDGDIWHKSLVCNTKPERRFSRGEALQPKAQPQQKFTESAYVVTWTSRPSQYEVSQQVRARLLGRLTDSVGFFFALCRFLCSRRLPPVPGIDLPTDQNGKFPFGTKHRRKEQKCTQ